MKQTVFFVLASLALLAGCSPSSRELSSRDITAEDLRASIRYLASDELKGRKAGEEGNVLAAQFIARHFQEDGLVPIGDDGGYFQNFSFVSTTRVGERNVLSATLSGRTLSYRVEKDFRPLSFSADTTLTAPLVFAGYGISAPDSLNYNDYAGIDVKNKIVVILRYSPDTSSADKFSAFTSLTTKIFTAREKGAAGVIFAASRPGTQGAALTSFHEPRLANAGIAVISMLWSDLDSLFSLAGKDLGQIQQHIISTISPGSFELEGAAIHLETQLVKVYAKTANIAGFLPGSDPALQGQVIVIGGHMDHLGMGGEGSGSLRPDTLAVHHGADDNASGTAGVLELAKYFSARRDSLKRSMLFLSFTGEELGLLGSDYYVNHPLKPLDSTVAMINMDMVGRMKDSVLVLEGMGTSPDWEALVKRENTDSLSLKLKPDGFGPSDHASFYKMNIPVIFFFTNLHSDYHKPSDTWDKINYSGEKTVLSYAARVVRDIDTQTKRPAFTKVVASAGMGAGGDRAGVRVSLGIIPDFAEDVPGMKISGTRPGSPAEKAGLKAGDVITKFGGRDVKNIYDFTYLLGQFKPGDKVQIIVKRGAEDVTLEATLEAVKR